MSRETSGILIDLGISKARDQIVLELSLCVCACVRACVYSTLTHNVTNHVHSLLQYINCCLIKSMH